MVAYSTLTNRHSTSSCLILFPHRINARTPFLWIWTACLLPVHGMCVCLSCSVAVFTNDLFSACSWMEDSQASRRRLLPCLPVTILRNRVIHLSAALRESLRAFPHSEQPAQGHQPIDGNARRGKAGPVPGISAIQALPRIHAIHQGKDRKGALSFFPWYTLC
jgi:hypothetical protein